MAPDEMSFEFQRDQAIENDRWLRFERKQQEVTVLNALLVAFRLDHLIVSIVPEDRQNHQVDVWLGADGFQVTEIPVPGATAHKSSRERAQRYRDSTSFEDIVSQAKGVADVLPQGRIGWTELFVALEAWLKTKKPYSHKDVNLVAYWKRQPPVRQNELPDWPFARCWSSLSIIHNELGAAVLYTNPSAPSILKEWEGLAEWCPLSKEVEFWRL